MENAKFALHALAQNENLALQNIVDPFCVILVLITPDRLVKSPQTVTPVKTGVQNLLKQLDSDFRQDDENKPQGFLTRSSFKMLIFHFSI